MVKVVELSSAIQLQLGGVKGGLLRLTSKRWQGYCKAVSTMSAKYTLKSSWFEGKSRLFGRISTTRGVFGRICRMRLGLVGRICRMRPFAQSW